MKKINFTISLPRWVLDIITSQNTVGADVKINWTSGEIPEVKKEVEVLKDDPVLKGRRVTFFVVDEEGYRREIEKKEDIRERDIFLVRVVLGWAKERGKDQFEITIWEKED